MLTSTASDYNVARAELISLLRGSLSCPVVATLAELGICDRMLASPFDVDAFPSIPNRAALESIFTYLQSIGLAAKTEAGSYELTRGGRSVFLRSGGFLLLHSYRDYFTSLGKLLRGEEQNGIAVDRLHNVLGSGSLHSRKFFPSAWRILGATAPDAFIDIGCGDGHFLEDACRRFPACEIAAIDLSEVSVKATLRRLSAATSAPVTGVVASGEDVEDWLAKLPQTICYSTRPVISLWFVAHEFSRGEPERIICFFEKLHDTFPAAEVVLGEITAIHPDLLAENRNTSIMPEFLLFHALSRQGVLSWKCWQNILLSIPYMLLAEEHFDCIAGSAGERTPSSFLWHLQPV